MPTFETAVNQQRMSHQPMSTMRMGAEIINYMGICYTVAIVTVPHCFSFLQTGRVLLLPSLFIVVDLTVDGASPLQDPSDQPLWANTTYSKLEDLAA